MAENNKALTIREYVTAPAVQKKMAEMFTDKRLMDNFVQSVISIAGSDELLAVAEPRSVFNACLMAASLNLPINKNLGFAHIIGYKNSRKNMTEAQFQLGARGFKELAQRTGQYIVINQGDVREGELKGRDRLTGELKFEWVEDDAIRQDLPVIGYFSYFKLKSGYASTLYMSLDEIKAHGKRYSQSYKKGFGPWVDNFDAMALKTVSKLNISKNGPLSIELQRAVEADQGVIRDDGADYVDGTDLASVNADEDKKKAIIEAHTDQEMAENVVPPEEGRVTSLDQLADEIETAQDSKSKTRKSLKQAGLLDDSTPRRRTGK